MKKLLTSTVSLAVLVGAMSTASAKEGDFTGYFSLGQGALRPHHLFVWPAFGLLIGLATWRLFTGPRSPRPQFVAYLVVTAAAAALMSAAGYWGGELALAS